jgi:hypothetical protein
MGDYSQALWYPLEDCTLVRAAVSPDLGERDLPDAIIDSPVYAYLAVRDVQGRFPTWAALTPDQQNAVGVAMAPYVPAIPTFFTLGKGHRAYTPPDPVTTGRPPQLSPPPYPPEGWG